MNGNSADACSVNAGRYCVALILLALLIFPVYANSIHASWQMDDKPNILDNERLHIDNLMPETLYQTFIAYPGTVKKLYRPFACFTFALNWYFGKDDPVGYHWINIIIHVLTAFVLFLITKGLFNTPMLEGKYKPEEIYFVSLLSASLWAINPIQTQAVTYIVQRMTALAALFYLLGLFLYLQARFTPINSRKVIYFSGCTLSFLCSFSSKENAAMFPLALILLEIAFFDFSLRTMFQKTSQTLLLCLGILILLVFLLYYSKGDPFFFLKGYAHRSFSFMERILTQPRVLLFYLSLIFYPLPQRLSIDHDIPLSQSLMHPWTTLPSILIVFALFGIGVILLKKRPLIGFAVLFFFLNHLIESSVIALEIIFEHRNYLPSAFLFLPVALLIHHSIRHLKKIGWASVAVIAFTVLLLINLGIGTHIRNMAWATNVSLWEDAAKKAPGNSRPLVNLAIELGWKKNASSKDLSLALYLSEKALSLYVSNPLYQAEVYGNIAGVFFNVEKFDTALPYYEKALDIDPFFIKNRYDLAKTLILLKRFEEASLHLDFVLQHGALKTYKYANLKGFVLLWQNRYVEALPFLQAALKTAPEEGPVLLNLGVALSRLGSFKNAEWFLLRAAKSSPEDMMPYFFLIENAIRGKDLDQAQRYAKKLLAHSDLVSITKYLNMTEKDPVFPPIEKNRIAPIIRQAIKNFT